MPVANSRRSYSGGAQATSVAQTINDTDTSITVDDASTFPATGGLRPFAIILDRGEPNEEVVFVGDKSGNIFTSVERGEDGTQAYSHAVGATVEHVDTAQDADEANAHIADTTASLVPHVQHVHKTVAQTVSAAHTYSGNSVHTGNETFTNATVTTLAATSAAITTATGNTAFSGTPVFANATFTASPTMPMATTVTTLNGDAGAVGVSVKPAKEDHEHPLDLTAITNLVTPAGKIEAFAGASVPTGWLLCDGAAVSRTTYAGLFTALSTTWGSGNGTTTFNVPDFRGRVLTGVDGAHALGATGGSLTKTLTTTELPAHNHPVNITDPGHVHMSSNSDNFVTGTSSTVGLTSTGTNQAAITGSDLTASSTTNVTATTTNTGTGSAFNIEQPWAGVNYIIKAH